MYPLFGYYQNSNEIHYGLFLRKFNTTLGGLLKPFSSTGAGYKWNYAKNESLYYFRQEFKPIFNEKVRTVYQDVSSGRGVEVLVGEAQRKTSLKFEKDLKPEKRPDIFRHSFVTDPDNFAYVKLI
jgi:hypothetical protein